MGASLCMILSSWGSAWGTWRAGLGVCNMGIDHPAGVIKNIVPIVMAGVLGIYGLIVSVIITQAVVPPNQSDGTNVYSSFNGYTHVSLVILILLCLRYISDFPFIPLACFLLARCWIVLRSFLFGGWRYHWYSWRCWCARVWS